MQLTAAPKRCINQISSAPQMKINRNPKLKNHWVASLWQRTKKHEILVLRQTSDILFFSWDGGGSKSRKIPPPSLMVVGAPHEKYSYGYMIPTQVLDELFLSVSGAFVENSVNIWSFQMLPIPQMKFMTWYIWRICGQFAILKESPFICDIGLQASISKVCLKTTNKFFSALGVRSSINVLILSYIDFICGIEEILYLNRFAEFSWRVLDTDKKISLVTWVGTFRKKFQFRHGTSTDGTLRGGGKNRDFYPPLASIMW